MTNITIDRKISLGSIINGLLVVSAVIIAFTWLQADVNTIKNQHIQYDAIHQQLRETNVTREHLDYSVIQRLDRFESRLNARLESIEQKIGN